MRAYVEDDFTKTSSAESCLGISSSVGPFLLSFVLAEQGLDCRNETGPASTALFSQSKPILFPRQRAVCVVAYRNLADTDTMDCLAE